MSFIHDIFHRQFQWSKAVKYIVTVFVILLVVYLRTSGLFRGLGEINYTYHPDEPKQVQALTNFLQGDYYHLYGSLFYDGYPYGLNHLDEYLLRPILNFFSSEYPQNSDNLYHASRLLRLLYSCSVLFLCSVLVFRITQNYYASLLPLVFLGLSPLAISVAHFASGDIGVDLFTAIGLFCLLLFTEKQKRYWLFLTGFSVGAAFSAKYNGLLLAFAPLCFLMIQFVISRNVFRLVQLSIILVSGIILGIFVFTPNLLVETKPSILNIIDNFTFIKNYSVPEEIISLPWYTKAILGLERNTWTIVSSLGVYLLLMNLVSIPYLIKKLRTSGSSENTHTLFLLTLTVFTPCALLLSLAGKYVVQPFHFSYIQVPLAIVSSVFVFQLFQKSRFSGRIVGLILLLVISLEFGIESANDNFFWRREDNVYYSQILPFSLYKKSALYTYERTPIRSVVLEPPNSSVFRNRMRTAEGPDAEYWKSIRVAPLPQVNRPIGKTWIFLNGPTFPKNDKSLVIHAGNRGATLKRYLVLPQNTQLLAVGLRCGSLSTKTRLKIGENGYSVSIDAHKQLLLPVDQTTSKSNDIQIIPIEIRVPHNSLWLSFFTHENEIANFKLFGGKGKSDIPSTIQTLEKESFLSAASHIRYLENDLSRRVNAEQSWPLWDVALPAGRYILTFDVEGIDDESRILMRFSDASGKGPNHQSHIFSVTERIQRFDYVFTKPFKPYQIRFTVQGLQGSCRIKNMQLRPDADNLFHDFVRWRESNTVPPWAGAHE